MSVQDHVGCPAQSEPPSHRRIAHRVGSGGAAALLGLAGALGGATAAQAYSWDGTCHWYNADNQYANYTSSLYYTASRNAIVNWSDTTDINMTAVGSAGITIATDYASNGNAGTTVRSCNGLGFYTEAHVYGNTYYMAAYGAQKKQMIFAHEAGHVFGLNHSANTHVLMYFDSTPYDSFGIYTPQSDDRAGVNAHY
jgi:hypothetical protein